MIFLPHSATMILHIPKCGGTWVERALTAGGVNFVLLNKHAHKPPMQQTRYVATFVRHPIEWYRSYWRFHTGVQTRHAPLPTGTLKPTTFNPYDLQACGDPDFTRFGENCLQRLPAYVTHLFDLYTRAADWVGKRERLSDDLVALLTEREEPFDRSASLVTPPANVNLGPDVRWPVELETRVALCEADAFARYDYALPS